MNKNALLEITTNMLAVFLLISLVVAPLYFSKNFTQVAGVKSQTGYLLVSQVEKFPGSSFTQEEKNYELRIRKQGGSQVFLSIFIINNPTDKAKTYRILNLSQTAYAFFGQEVKNKQFTISVPSQVSVPISVISEGTAYEDSVKFSISEE